MTYPGPRTHELNEASVDLRGAVSTALRRGNRWLTPEELLAANSPRVMLDAARRLSSASTRVAQDYHEAFNRLAGGHAHLWVPARARESEQPGQRPSHWVRLDSAGRGLVVSMMGEADTGLTAFKSLSAQAASITRDRAWRSASGAAQRAGDGRSPEPVLGPASQVDARQASRSHAAMEF